MHAGTHARRRAHRLRCFTSTCVGSGAEAGERDPTLPPVASPEYWLSRAGRILITRRSVAVGDRQDVVQTDGVLNVDA